MRTILIGLALAVIVILLVLLALLVIMRAGIRRQERAACLICHPPGPDRRHRPPRAPHGLPGT